MTRRSVFILLLASFFSVPATATTVIKLSLEKMALSSDVIAHGSVTRVEVVAVNGNQRHLRTDVTIQVRDMIKGDRGTKELTLKLIGGTRGKWAMRIPGMPSFKQGEEVVLFLEKTSVSYALTGLAQGKFSVQIRGSKKMVRRNLSGMHFMGFDKTGKMAEVAPPRDNMQVLSALLAETRHVIEQAKKAD